MQSEEEEIDNKQQLNDHVNILAFVRGSSRANVNVARAGP